MEPIPLHSLSTIFLNLNEESQFAIVYTACTLAIIDAVTRLLILP